MNPPLIAVLGATGAQGGGLARTLLADPSRRFAVRAVTRKADSPAARALAAQGAEVAIADLDDEASLRRAFAGAHGVYAVTNFWEHFSPAREIAQAGNIAAAAAASHVKHVVWSTLEDTRERVPLADPRLPTLQEKYKTPHFDAKGEADALFRGLPTTYLRTSFYWDNLIHFGMGPRRNADGTLDFVLPLADGRLPGIAAADIGACAAGVFREGESLAGRVVGIAGDILAGDEMAAALGRALGRTVRYAAIPFDAYAGLGFPGADDLANMFHYQYLFNAEFCAARSVARSRELNPALMGFDAWLAANAARIPEA